MSKLRFSFTERKKTVTSEDRDGSTLKMPFKGGTLSVKRSLVVNPFPEHEGSPVLLVSGPHRGQAGVLYSTKSSSKFLVQLLGKDGLSRPAGDTKSGGTARRNSSLASVPPSDMHVLSLICLAELRGLHNAHAGASKDELFTGPQLDMLTEKAADAFKLPSTSGPGGLRESIGSLAKAYEGSLPQYRAPDGSTQPIQVVAMNKSGGVDIRLNPNTFSNSGITIYQPVSSPAPGRLFIKCVVPPVLMMGVSHTLEELEAMSAQERMCISMVLPNSVAGKAAAAANTAANAANAAAHEAAASSGAAADSVQPSSPSAAVGTGSCTVSNPVTSAAGASSCPEAGGPTPGDEATGRSTPGSTNVTAPRIVTFAMCVSGGKPGDSNAAETGIRFPNITARGYNTDIPVELQSPCRASKVAILEQLSQQKRQQQLVLQQQHLQQQQKQWLQEQQALVAKLPPEQQAQQKQELLQFQRQQQSILPTPPLLPIPQESEKVVGEFMFVDMVATIPSKCLGPGQVVIEAWSDDNHVHTFSVLLLDKGQEQVSAELTEAHAAGTLPAPMLRSFGSWMQQMQLHRTSAKNAAGVCDDIAVTKGCSCCICMSKGKGMKDGQADRLIDGAISTWITHTGCWVLNYAISRGWMATASVVLNDLIGEDGCGLPFADISRGQDSSGKSMLHHAVQSGNLHMISQVIKWGAQYKSPWSWSVRDAMGATPLHVSLLLRDNGRTAQALLCLPSAREAWLTAGCSAAPHNPSKMVPSPCQLARALFGERDWFGIADRAAAITAALRSAAADLPTLATGLKEVERTQPAACSTSSPPSPAVPGTTPTAATSALVEAPAPTAPAAACAMPTCSVTLRAAVVAAVAASTAPPPSPLAASALSVPAPAGPPMVPAAPAGTRNRPSALLGGIRTRFSPLIIKPSASIPVLLLGFSEPGLEICYRLFKAGLVTSATGFWCVIILLVEGVVSVLAGGTQPAEDGTHLSLHTQSATLLLVLSTIYTSQSWAVQAGRIRDLELINMAIGLCIAIFMSYWIMSLQPILHPCCKHPALLPMSALIISLFGSILQINLPICFLLQGIGFGTCGWLFASQRVDSPWLHSAAVNGFVLLACSATEFGCRHFFLKYELSHLLGQPLEAAGQQVKQETWDDRLQFAETLHSALLEATAPPACSFRSDTKNGNPDSGAHTCAMWHISGKDVLNDNNSLRWDVMEKWAFGSSPCDGGLL